MSAALTPNIVTASIEPGTDDVVLRGDGAPLIRLTRIQTLWLIARLAEALLGKP